MPADNGGERDKGQGREIKVSLFCFVFFLSTFFLSLDSLKSQLGSDIKVGGGGGRRFLATLSEKRRWKRSATVVRSHFPRRCGRHEVDGATKQNKKKKTPPAAAALTETAAVRESCIPGSYFHLAPSLIFSTFSFLLPKLFSAAFFFCSPQPSPLTLTHRGKPNGRRPL